ncbi:MAG: hypothetical protein HQK54_12000, partial [Oligoflexales bacterium]|nr:hypothetical protein [Oligoflexales bacterium]
MKTTNPFSSLIVVLSAIIPFSCKNGSDSMQLSPVMEESDKAGPSSADISRESSETSEPVKTHASIGSSVCNTNEYSSICSEKSDPNFCFNQYRSSCLKKFSETQCSKFDLAGYNCESAGIAGNDTAIRGEKAYRCVDGCVILERIVLQDNKAAQGPQTTFNETKNTNYSSTSPYTKTSPNIPVIQAAVPALPAVPAAPAVPIQQIQTQNIGEGTPNCRAYNTDGLTCAQAGLAGLAAGQTGLPFWGGTQLWQCVS